jgi:hypothetical protein
MEKVIRDVIAANVFSELRVGLIIASTTVYSRFVYVEYIGADQNFWVAQMTRPDTIGRSTWSPKMSSWNNGRSKRTLASMTFVESLVSMTGHLMRRRGSQ